MLKAQCPAPHQAHQDFIPMNMIRALQDFMYAHHVLVAVKTSFRFRLAY